MHTNPPPDFLNVADLPAWVQWLAQDADGTWWAYEAEPNEADHGWYENEVGRCLKLEGGAETVRANPAWRASLQRRPG